MGVRYRRHRGGGDLLRWGGAKPPITKRECPQRSCAARSAPRPKSARFRTGALERRGAELRRGGAADSETLHPPLSTCDRCCSIAHLGGGLHAGTTTLLVLFT